MALLYKLMEIWLCPKVRVQFGDIHGPVAMVTIRCVHRNRWNPYGVHSQALYVVESIDNAPEGPTAVGGEVWAWCRASTGRVEPVCEDLQIVTCDNEKERSAPEANLEECT